MLEKLKGKVRNLSSQKRKELLMYLFVMLGCVFILTVFKIADLRETGFTPVERNVTCEQYGYETLIKVNDTFSWCSGNKYVWGGTGKDPVKKQKEVNYLNVRN